jgi:hypothetical protein
MSLNKNATVPDGGSNLAATGGTVSRGHKKAPQQSLRGSSTYSLPIRGRTGREAVAAVDRLVATRLERHFGRLPALAASRLEHLAATAARRSTVTAAAAATAGTALGLAGRAAFGTTIGFILEAFAREELLLSRTKNELAVTINAAQGFICVHYWDSLFGI